MDNLYPVITEEDIINQPEKECFDCQHTKKQLVHIREQLATIKNAIHLLESNLDLIESNFRPATDDSIIIENTKDGYIVKKVPSILGGSYVIMEDNKQLEQLSQKEQTSIRAQNDYHKYKNTVDTGKGIIDTYSIFSVVVSMSKWITPIL